MSSVDNGDSQVWKARLQSHKALESQRRYPYLSIAGLFTGGGEVLLDVASQDSGGFAMVSQRARMVLNTVVELSELFLVPLLSKHISIYRVRAKSKGGPYLFSKSQLNFMPLTEKLEAATYI